MTGSHAGGPVEADQLARAGPRMPVDLRTTRQAMIRAGDLGSAVLGIASELGFLKAVARESQLMAECVSTQAS